MPKGYIRLLWKWWSHKLRRGLIGLKLDVLVTFLKVKVLGGTCFPCPYILLVTNAYNKNFEIAIYLKIVSRSYNKAFEVDRIPQNLRVRVASYASGAYKVFMEGVVV